MTKKRYMKNHTQLLIVLLSAITFTILFYDNTLGINLLIFEYSVLGWLYYSKQFRFQVFNVKLIAAAIVLTSIMTLIHHSTLSFTINILLFFLFIGVISAPSLRSLAGSFEMSFHSFFMSFIALKKKTGQTRINSKKAKFRIWSKRIFLIPVLIIIVFSAIYSWANPKFGEIVNSVLNSLEGFFTYLFSNINFALFSVFILGLMISVFLFIRSNNKRLIKRDEDAGDTLIRVRKNSIGKLPMLGLVNEYKSAIFLFASLNILLFGLNFMDINYVWFNFKWEGQYLKEFVHEGTYILIFAILLSVVLVLYFFRRNLNFYQKNKWLKRLAIIWIIQNLVLTISVGIRNWHYIQYYSLAYKRIAIIFFLCLTIYGLYTVFLKVRNTKSNYYLLRTNSISLILVLILSTTVNWDRVIARYNFVHAKTGFVHLNFLASLSNSALPLLDKTESDLKGIQLYQENSFFKGGNLGSSPFSYRKIYMSTEIYLNEVKRRKQKFRKSWESKNWLEWNYAEWRSYKTLK